MQALYELLPDDEAAALMKERNKPWAVIRKMTRLAKECGSSVPAHVRRQLELYISGETSCALSCSVPAPEPHAAGAARHIWKSCCDGMQLLLVLLTIVAIYSILAAPASEGLLLCRARWHHGSM